MSEYILGMDPGKSGALCFLPIAGGDLIYMVTPEIKGTTEIDLYALYRFAHPLLLKTKVCLIEDVHSIFGSSAKSNFQFGRALGNIEMLPVLFGIPCVKIQPKKWQKVAWEGVVPVTKPTKAMRAVKGGKKGEKAEVTIQKVDTKATSLIAAKRLFPTETFLKGPRCSTPHDGVVDAALIAYAGKVQNL